MAYVSPNVKTKKDLKERVARGERLDVFQASLGEVPLNGTICLEGPHYPAPHTWYAEGTMVGGKLVRVK